MHVMFKITWTSNVGAVVFKKGQTENMPDVLLSRFLTFVVIKSACQVKTTVFIKHQVKRTYFIIQYTGLKQIFFSPSSPSI